eukprot:Seg1707.11 transcript_id=Seg1707.11/GoldUCD/mRNA.D3Y31 product="3-hydroxypropionyl-coenzyme A dehydratase" protein_id=Seg1707.11/GoldUCD/D3Y31
MIPVCRNVFNLHRYLLPKTTKRMLTTTKQDGIFYITLNRPEKQNAVNLETASLLFDAFKKFNACQDTSVGILHGNGGNFCAGFDLEELSSLDEQDVSELQEWNYEKKAPMGPSRLHLKKPMIAAVSGHAVAGGLELSLLCDLRILEEDAVMGVFCRRFGVPLIDGGTVRLPKLIGLSRALDLILTGRPVSANEALDIGLANRVVPKGNALEEATKLAKELMQFPQQCMLADRESAYNVTFEADSIESALKFEFQNGIKVIREESVQGAKQFVSGKGKHGKFESKL